MPTDPEVVPRRFLVFRRCERCLVWFFDYRLPYGMEHRRKKYCEGCEEERRAWRAARAEESERKAAEAAVLRAAESAARKAEISQAGREQQFRNNLPKWLGPHELMLFGGRYGKSQAYLVRGDDETLESLLDAYEDERGWDEDMPE